MVRGLGVGYRCRVKVEVALAQLAFIGVAAVAVYGFVQAAQTDTRRSSCTAICSFRPAYAGDNRIAPDFELSDLNGHKVKLSDYRGKTVVLNFWTKTCKPCLEEMPALAELAKIAANRSDFAVLTVSIDAGPDDVRDTLRVALGDDVPPFAVLFDPESDIVAGRYGTKLFPETWVIDPNGVIRARFDGARDWSDSLAIELAERAGRPGMCPIPFERGQPQGPFAGLCGDDS